MFTCLPPSVKVPTLKTVMSTIMFMIFSLIMGGAITILEILRLGTEDVRKWNATFIEFNPEQGTATLHVHFVHSIDKLSIVFYAFAMVCIVMFIADVISENHIEALKDSLLLQKQNKKKPEDTPLTETLLNKI